jgi:pyruvate/2-oxoglutarate dehydrogenase complex dihydrolipoamide acyltransferase (E2) component
MGWGPWVAALLTAALFALPPAHAQQQDTPPPEAPADQSGTPLHERIGSAIRGFFQSIFGDSRPEREGELSDRPDAAPGAQPAGEGAAAEPAPAAAPPASAPAPQAAPAPPVVATPSASATQSLHSAIGKGDYAAAIKMIEAGGDIDAKDPNAGATALHYAVMKGEMPLVALLVQRGADVNSRTRSGTTPLHTAVLYRRTEIAEYLIQKGAEVNAKSPSGATPFGLAIAANYHTLANMLRSYGGQ